MEALIHHILQFGSLNPQQIEFITRKAAGLTLPKEGYFSEAGKVAREVGFLLEGVLRVCYYNNKGEEITNYFIDENHFVVDLESFDNNIPSTGYVQAVTECRLVVFSSRDWEEIANTIVGWESILNKITKKALLQKIERRSPLVAEDATTRYLAFLEKYPRIANRVSLSSLASYLGVTPSSLSRIRKNIR